jgi:hypothetical protein
MMTLNGTADILTPKRLFHHNSGPKLCTERQFISVI